MFLSGKNSTRRVRQQFSQSRRDTRRDIVGEAFLEEDALAKKWFSQGSTYLCTETRWFRCSYPVKIRPDESASNFLKAEEILRRDIVGEAFLEEDASAKNKSIGFRTAYERSAAQLEPLLLITFRPYNNSVLIEPFCFKYSHANITLRN